MFESVASFNLLEHLCDATFVPPTGPALYPRQIDPSRRVRGLAVIPGDPDGDVVPAGRFVHARHCKRGT